MTRSLNKTVQLVVVCGAAVFAAYSGITGKPAPSPGAPAPLRAEAPPSPAQPAPETVAQQTALVDAAPAATSPEENMVLPPMTEAEPPLVENPYSKERMEASLAALLGSEPETRAAALEAHREKKTRSYLAQAARSQEVNHTPPLAQADAPAGVSDRRMQAERSAENPYNELLSQLPPDEEVYAEERAKRLAQYMKRTVQLH